MRKHIFTSLVAFTGAVVMTGCLGTASKTASPTDPAPSSPAAPDPAAPATPTPSTPATMTPSTPTPSTPATPAAPDPAAALAARVIDYGQATRTAAIKLIGTAPTVDELTGVTDATSYAAQVDKYLADPRFAGQIFSYFEDMLKMGGPASTTAPVHPSFDTAPSFAAELAVNDRPITDLFTATTTTCPTLNTATGVFTDATCTPSNGLPTAGILTDPGAMSQYFSNMAFRRVRWIQETFVCTKFPAEYRRDAGGDGQRVSTSSPWPFNIDHGRHDPRR